MNNAQKALDGINTHLEFGQWPDMQEDKSVAVQGTHQNSSYAVTDSEGIIKEQGQLSGERKQIVNIKKGQSLRVVYCLVEFQAGTAE